MKVFISSLISGLEGLRDAAASGITTLGHQPVRAEDLGASPDRPQQACLADVREADALVLLLGPAYGTIQESGLSATHEEYREGRDSKPVLAFIQQDIDAEAKQAAFIDEIQNWERGHFTTSFRDIDDLRGKVIRALHEYVLANETAPLDEAELAQRAQALIPTTRQTAGTDLLIAVAGGPVRPVLRPAELEKYELRRFLLAEALTGADALLTPSAGTNVSVRGDAIELVQSSGSGVVTLDEAANLVTIQPAIEDAPSHSGIPSLLEEVITVRIARALRLCARILDHVDPARRLSHVAPVAALRGAGYMPWRTRAEQDRQPDSVTLSLGAADHVAVALAPPVRRRAALLQDTQQLAEDFTVRLRRQVKQ